LTVEPITLTRGETEFVWRYDGSLAEDQGFEVRVWREGEPPLGVHDTIADNLSGKIVPESDGSYHLVIDITSTPPVAGRAGEYWWSVYLIQLPPDSYRLLGPRSEPGTFEFILASSGANGGKTDDFRPREGN
jgi:hypothetical protein